MRYYEWPPVGNLGPSPAKGGRRVIGNPTRSQVGPVSQEWPVQSHRPRGSEGPCTWVNVLLLLLKFLIIFELGPLHFHFAWGAATYAADPDHIQWVVRDQKKKNRTEGSFLPKTRLGNDRKSQTGNIVSMCPAPHEIDCELLWSRDYTLFSAVCSLKWCLAFSFN